MGHLHIIFKDNCFMHPINSFLYPSILKNDNFIIVIGLSIINSWTEFPNNILKTKYSEWILWNEIFEIKFFRTWNIFWNTLFWNKFFNCFERAFGNDFSKSCCMKCVPNFVTKETLSGKKNFSEWVLLIFSLFWRVF